MYFQVILVLWILTGLLFSNNLKHTLHGRVPAFPITALLYSWKLLYTLHCNQPEIRARLLLKLGTHQFAVRQKNYWKPHYSAVQQFVLLLFFFLVPTCLCPRWLD